MRSLHGAPHVLLPREEGMAPAVGKGTKMVLRNMSFCCVVYACCVLLGDVILCMLQLSIFD